MLYTLALTGLVSVGVALYDFIALNINGTGIATYGYWLTLQVIGFAGLLALLLIDVKVWYRLGIVIGIFAIFTIYHEIGSNSVLLDVVADGGFFGGFGFAVIVIVATIIGELYYKNKETLYISAGILTALSIPAFFLCTVNKGSVSPSFIIIGLAISAIAYIIFDLFNFYKPKFDFLGMYGKNPLLLYMLEFGFVGGLTQFLPETMVKTAPIWLAIIWLVVVTAVLTTIAWLLSRKQKVVKF